MKYLWIGAKALYGTYALIIFFRLALSEDFKPITFISEGWIGIVVVSMIFVIGIVGFATLLTVIKDIKEIL